MVAFDWQGMRDFLLAIPMILSVREGHSPISSLFGRDFSCDCTD